MGTNYYWREDPCGRCGRFDELHVGKSSLGWVFLWQGHDRDSDTARLTGSPLDSAKAWIDFLRSGKGDLFDEYETKQDVEEFVAFVEAKRDKISRSSTEAQPHYAPGTWPSDSNVADPLGDDLSFREFS